MFEIHHSDGKARTGIVRTAHGELPTPAFMPVATLGSVKALDPSTSSPRRRPSPTRKALARI